MDKSEKLREEITERIKILHQIINLAILLIVFALCFIVWLLTVSAKIEQIMLFVLFLPIIFAFLTFNYQANQMTLEGLAKYLKEEGWESFYGQYKKGRRLTSFLKVLPLLAPQIVPLIIFPFFVKFSQFGVLIIIDFMLLLLVFINFRYKFKK
jgi:hypothetical protein